MFHLSVEAHGAEDVEGHTMTTSTPECEDHTVILYFCISVFYFRPNV